MLSAIKRSLSRLRSGKHDASSRTGLARFSRRHGHKLRNVVLGTLLVLVVLAALGFFAVPPLAKYYAVKTLSEQLDRDVTIRDIEFNPLSLNARVLGLTIRERRSAQTFVAFDELILNLEYRSLLRRAPVLKRVTLLRPYVHIARNLDGNSYNFSDLLAKFSKPATPEQNHSTPRFSLNNIQLVNGRLDFEDHPKRARHTVSEIEVAIPFISNLPDVVDLYVQPAFSARVNGTPVALQGRTKPFKETLETSIDLNIERLDLPRYVEYVPVKLGFQLASGLLDTRLTASFVRNHDGAPLLKVRGDFGVEKLSIRELTGAPLFNLAALHVPVTGIDLLERKIALGNIAFTSPELFVRRDKDGGVNWMHVRPQLDGPAPKATQTSDTPSIALSVAELAIHDGLLHLDDRVPANGFRSELSAIQASLHEFALPQAAPAQVDVSFNTNLGETVKLGASVLVNPLSAEGNIELNKIRLRNYEPYYQELIAYRLEDGTADFSSRYALTTGTDGPKVKLSELNLALASVRLRKPGEKEDFLRARSVADSQCLSRCRQPRAIRRAGDVS